MPGQPPVVTAVTAVAAAAVLLVSPTADVAAFVVTDWRTPAWLLMSLLAMLMAILAATCVERHVSVCSQSNHRIPASVTK